MKQPMHLHLSRRESQIMDIVYRLGEASVSDVVARMPDRPAYNTVRNKLAVLEEKGHLQHRREGKRYLYTPTVPAARARRSAARHLLDTFCNGEPTQAILTLLGVSARKLTPEDLDEIAEWIDDARRDAASPTTD